MAARKNVRGSMETDGVVWHIRTTGQDDRPIDYEGRSMSQRAIQDAILAVLSNSGIRVISPELFAARIAEEHGGTIEDVIHTYVVRTYCDHGEEDGRVVARE